MSIISDTASGSRRFGSAVRVLDFCAGFFGWNSMGVGGWVRAMLHLHLGTDVIFVKMYN